MQNYAFLLRLSLLFFFVFVLLKNLSYISIILKPKLSWILALFQPWNSSKSFKFYFFTARVRPTPLFQISQLLAFPQNLFKFSIFCLQNLQKIAQSGFKQYDFNNLNVLHYACLIYFLWKNGAKRNGTIQTAYKMST